MHEESIIIFFFNIQYITKRKKRYAVYNKNSLNQSQLLYPRLDNEAVSLIREYFTEQFQYFYLHERQDI